MQNREFVKEEKEMLIRRATRMARQTAGCGGQAGNRQHTYVTGPKHGSGPMCVGHAERVAPEPGRHRRAVACLNNECHKQERRHEAPGGVKVQAVPSPRGGEKCA